MNHPKRVIFFILFSFILNLIAVLLQTINLRVSEQEFFISGEGVLVCCAYLFSAGISGIGAKIHVRAL